MNLFTTFLGSLLTRILSLVSLPIFGAVKLIYLIIRLYYKLQNYYYSQLNNFLKRNWCKMLNYNLLSCVHIIYTNHFFCCYSTIILMKIPQVLENKNRLIIYIHCL
jgi:hypothetical protein